MVVIMIFLRVVILYILAGNYVEEIVDLVFKSNGSFLLARVGTNSLKVT
jgi:hypothetical protein